MHICCALSASDRRGPPIQGMDTIGLNTISRGDLIFRSRWVRLSHSLQLPLHDASLCRTREANTVMCTTTGVQCNDLSISAQFMRIREYIDLTVHFQFQIFTCAPGLRPAQTLHES